MSRKPLPLFICVNLCASVYGNDCKYYFGVADRKISVQNYSFQIEWCTGGDSDDMMKIEKCVCFCFCHGFKWRMKLNLKNCHCQSFLTILCVNLCVSERERAHTPTHTHLSQPAKSHIFDYKFPLQN